MSYLRPRTGGYSRAEKVSDAVVHVAGVVSALIAVPVLVTLAVVWRGDAPALLGVAIYGLALIAMVFVGPRAPWGWVGLLPLITGLVGFCPAYRLLGVNTCPRR